MDRKEFLEGLKSYLESELSTEEVREHINYYERYITEEVVKGRREEEIVKELGDPWIIAKTITDMKDNQTEQKTSSYDSAYEEEKRFKQVRNIQVTSWLKRMAVILGVVAVVFVVFSLITGIIGLVAPILFPVLVVMMVFRFIGRRS